MMITLFRLTITVAALGVALIGALIGTLVALLAAALASADEHLVTIDDDEIDAGLETLLGETLRILDEASAR